MLLIALSAITHSTFAQQDVTLHFKAPAVSYTEALPLGNGRIGGLITGHPWNDRIMLNEISLWSGGVQDADSDTAYRSLPRIQELLDLYPLSSFMFPQALSLFTWC